MRKKQKHEFGIERYRRPYMIDDIHGERLVQYKVWRTTNPHRYGYGMTKNEAIYDLIHEVQPL